MSHRILVVDDEPSVTDLLAYNLREDARKWGKIKLRTIGVDMTRHMITTPTFITATEIRRNFAAIVRKIRRKREPAIIQSGGESIAVLMSMSEYERLLRYQKLAAFNKLARKIGEDVEKSGLTEQQLITELEETKREVFREQYGEL